MLKCFLCLGFINKKENIIYCITLNVKKIYVKLYNTKCYNLQIKGTGEYNGYVNCKRETLITTIQNDYHHKMV